MKLKDVVRKYYGVEEGDIYDCKKYAEKRSYGDNELFQKLFEDSLEKLGISSKDIRVIVTIFSKELEEDIQTSNNTGIDANIGMNKRNPKYKLDNMY